MPGPSPGTGVGVAPATREAVTSALRASFDAAGEAAAGIWIEWAHVDSAFVSVGLALDTSHVPSELRLYLPLLFELWWKLPAVLDDGTHLSKDKFVAALEDETVGYRANIGMGRGARVKQLASIELSVEGGEGGGLPTALQWLRRALYQTTTSAAHVRMAAKNMASRLPAAFREGDQMVSHVLDCALYDSRANRVAECPMRQQP